MPLTRAARPLPVDAVLFDLDGTLADTAPATWPRALNRVRADRGPRRRCRSSDLRAVRLVRRARPARRGHGHRRPSIREYAALRDAFLAHYAACLARDDDAVRRRRPSCSTAIEARGAALGHRHQQVRALHRAGRRGARARARAPRSSCRGDTTPHAKPHPGAAAACGDSAARRAVARASTSATTCATSRPATPPAWRRSSPTTATWASAAIRGAGRRPAGSTSRGDLLDWLPALRGLARTGDACMARGRSPRSAAATRAARRRASRRGAPAGWRVSGRSTALDDVVGRAQRDAVGLLDAIALLHRRASRRSRCRRAPSSAPRSARRSAVQLSGCAIDAARAVPR